MKRYGKILFGVILWTVMMLGCVCAAWAAQLAIGELKVAFVDLVSDEDHVISTETYDVSSGSAALTYDENQNPVLTLRNFTAEQNRTITYTNTSVPLTIMLEGDNSVKGVTDDGLSSPGCSLIIDGSGTLEISSEGGIRAVDISNGSLTVNGGNVIVNGKSGSGIEASNGIITVNGGLLQARNTQHWFGNYYGIDASNGSVTIEEDGRLIAESLSYPSDEEPKAIKGTVINKVAGTGWDRRDNSTSIAVNSDGASLGYKRVQFPASVDYPLWIGGTHVTNMNCFDIPAEQGGTKTGTARYDAESNTLTLKNYVYEGVGHEWVSGNQAPVYYYGNDQLTIKLSGKNVVTQTGAELLSAAIYVENADLSITGDGELIASGGQAYSAGSYPGDSNGICCFGNVTVKGGTVTASANTAPGLSCGIQCSNNDMTVEAGHVTATGGEAGTGDSSGIIAGKLFIKGGTVYSTGGLYGIKNRGVAEIESGADFVEVISGASGSAFDSKYITAVSGTAWTNVAGTAGRTMIEKTSSPTIWNEDFKKVIFHDHSLSYALSNDGTTVTATCTKEKCTFKDKKTTLTIAAPLHTIFGDGKDADAVITDANGIHGDTKVQYYKAKEDGSKDGDALGAAPTSAGKYRAEITLGSGNNTATAFVVYEIKPITVTLDKDSLGFITGGDVATLTAAVGPDETTDKTVIWSVSGTNAGAVKLYSDADCKNEVGTAATSILTVYAKGESAGTATITAKSNADNTRTDTCEVTVEVAAPTSITVSNVTGYRGCDATVDVAVGTVSGLFSGEMEVTFPDGTTGTVQITDNSGSVSWRIPADFATGDDTVTVSYPTAANSTAEGTGTLTVKEPLIIVVDSVYYVGDNIVIALTIPSDAAEPVAVNVDGKDYVVSADLEVTIAGGLPAGNHTVTAALKYNGVDVTATKDFVVKKHDTGITVSADDVYYGGNVTVTATVSDDAQGKAVFYLDGSETGIEQDINNYTATCAFNGLSAGNHSVKAVLDDEYYTAESVPADFKVNKAPISPTISIASWTYGDTANVPTVEGNSGNGTIRYAYSGTDTAGADYNSDNPPVNAGRYSVTATIPETNNYEGATVEEYFTIATKGVPLVWGNTDLVYSGEPQVPTASVEGLFGSDTCSVNVSGAQTNVNAEGLKYTATLGEPQVDNPNYSINTDNGTTEFTISPKSITGATVTLDNDELTYNKSEQSVTVSAVKIGDLTVDTYEVSGDIKGTDVGSYTLTVTGTGNFKDSAAVGWKIVEKGMTVSAPDVNAEYDGQPHGITVTVSDPASGAEIKYGKTEGTYELDASPTITGAGELTVYYKVTAANYKDYTGSAKVTIAKKPAAVKAIDQTIKEGESIQTGTDYARLTGVLDGHTLGAVTLTPQNKEIVPSSAAIKNGDDDVTNNYSITYEPGTLTTSAKISATVTFKVLNGSWDDGKKKDKTITLTGSEGDTLKLAAKDIPAVGSKPNNNYKAGAWDIVPSTETEIKKDTTYTYTYKEVPLDKNALKIALNADLKVSWKSSRITVEYGKVPGATSYEIYAAYCGTDSFHKIKTTKKTRFSFKKLNKKKLKKNRCVKIYILAKKGDTILAKSLATHTAGPDNRYTSSKGINLKKKAVKLKKGKKAKIKAEVIPADSNKKLLPKGHAAKLRYATTDKNVAYVKNGKIVANGKGNCTIYVYAINGFPEKISVTVR